MANHLELEERGRKRTLSAGWVWTLATVAGLGCLVAGFYAVENVRGARAWAEVETLARSQGEPLTAAEVVPPPVPDAENFATTPLIAAIFSTDEAVAKAARVRWELQSPHASESAPGFNAEELEGKTVLEAWRAYLGTDDLLGYLEKYRADLDEIAEALKRPKVRFPVPYEDGFGVVVNVRPLIHLAEVFQLRAEARLEQGDGAGASSDTCRLLQLAHVVCEEPTLISVLTGAKMSEAAVRMIDAGMVKRVWSEADRQALEEQLKRVDLISAVWKALRAEFVFGAKFFRKDLQSSDPKGYAYMSFVFDERMIFVLRHICPSGWLDQNAAHHGRVFLEHIFPAFDPVARRVDFAGLEAGLRGARQGSESPYRLLAVVMTPTVNSLAAKLADVQTRIDQARVVLALERWREAHGAYPEQLAELPATDGVGDVRDLATGRAFVYRRNEDGSFLLYSIGADGRDGGGVEGEDRSSRTDRESGDWVWPKR